MDVKKKLEKKIEEWAVGLGYTLPDGSAPPPNYFAGLTATPHRRQLWEVLVESVRDRKKVLQMRKQLFLFNLKDKNKNFRVTTLNKPDTSRIALWEKQNTLETNINEKRKSTAEIEKIILTKASDLLFDIYKLIDLEKQCEEFKNKTLGLNLYTKKEKTFVEELRCILTSALKNSVGIFSEKHESQTEEKLLKLKEELLNVEQSKSLQECSIQSQIREFSQYGVKETCLWYEVINCKRIILEKFENFLQEANTTEKAVMKRKEEVENSLMLTIKKLKQEVIEKSLHVMINEAERRLLDSEIEKLMKKLELLILKGSSDASLNENISFVTEDEIDELSSKNKTLNELKNHLYSVGVKNYCKFLKEEHSKLEDECIRRKDEVKEYENKREEFQKSFDTTESISNEIDLLNSENDQHKGKINRLQDEMRSLARELESESKREDFISEVEDISEKLKKNSKTQIDLFLEVPVGVHKMTDDSSTCGKLSLSNCLDNFSREHKQFFRTMLISPHHSVEFVAREIEKRKKVAEKVKVLISEKNKFAESERKIFNELSSIKYDAQLCEKNFKVSDVILHDILEMANQLDLGMNFMKNILKNWVEQPYRHMISDTETVDGITLKEYEELYKKTRSLQTSRP